MGTLIDERKTKCLTNKATECKTNKRNANQNNQIRNNKIGDTHMTNTNTNTTNGNVFLFDSKADAISQYLAAKTAHEALLAKVAEQEAYMSDLCQTMLADYGTTDAETDKRSLQLDLGDGAARGHIVVQRGSLYFIRERNSGRPVGSKNKAKAVTAPVVEAQPEVVVEEPSVVAEPTVTESNLTPMEQALLIAEAEIAEQAGASAEAVLEGAESTDSTDSAESEAV